VVIRVRDEAAALEELLRILATQSEPHEVVVVDNSSTDASRAVAQAAGARVVDLAREDFTFGRALNRGCAVAAGDVLVSLSAHAHPRDDDWLARMTAHFEDPSVACAYGETRAADGAPLSAPVRQDAAMLERDPYWGYSNAAGAFRASLWKERPFREDLAGTEDREWSLWALRAGHVCVLDPGLAVEHDHSKDSLRACFQRYQREARGFRDFLDLEPYGIRDVVHEWWKDQGWHRSRARARLDPRRMARLAGKWSGRRA
jgi:rhamnosyltransferase